MLDVLLSTKNFNDLVTEVSAMRQLGQSDSATVSTITALKKQITQRRAALLTEGKQAETLVAQRSATRHQIEADLAERETKLKGVKQQIASMQAAAARAAKLAAERAAAAAAAAQAAAQAAPSRSRRRRRRHDLVGRLARLGGRRSRSDTWACPTSGAAPARRASTAPAWSCTATLSSASRCRTTQPCSTPTAPTSRTAPSSPATSSSSAPRPAASTTSASTSAAAP